MQHRRSTHASPDVRRASGQISKSWIEGEVEFAFKRGVDLIDQLECLFQLKTGTNGLHPEMIFFVDHDAERLPPIYNHRAARAFRGMLAADQVALDQHLLFQRREIL